MASPSQKRPFWTVKKIILAIIAIGISIIIGAYFLRVSFPTSWEFICFWGNTTGRTFVAFFDQFILFDGSLVIVGAAIYWFPKQHQEKWEKMEANVTKRILKYGFALLAGQFAIAVLLITPFQQHHNDQKQIDSLTKTNISLSDELAQYTNAILDDENLKDAEFSDTNVIYTNGMAYVWVQYGNHAIDIPDYRLAAQFFKGVLDHDTIPHQNHRYEARYDFCVLKASESISNTYSDASLNKLNHSLTDLRYEISRAVEDPAASEFRDHDILLNSVLPDLETIQNAVPDSETQFVGRIIAEVQTLAVKASNNVKNPTFNHK